MVEQATDPELAKLENQLNRLKSQRKKSGVARPKIPATNDEELEQVYTEGALKQGSAPKTTSVEPLSMSLSLVIPDDRLLRVTMLLA